MLMGLVWRVHVVVKFVSVGPFLGTLLVRAYLCSENAREQPRAFTVYPAKLRLCVRLPNGELVAEREDPVRHRFGRATFMVSNADLGNFLGQHNNMLHHSFTVHANVQVYGQPKIFHSPSYQKSVQIEQPSIVGESPYTAVAGYHEGMNRLVFWTWRIVNHEVTCWAMHPLVPSSLEQLAHTADMNEGEDILEEVFQAALSEDGCLAAYIAIGPPDHTYDLFVLHLGTKELVHRRYDNGPQATILRGLRHTSRGWVMWTGWMQQFTFYRLAEQMELLWSVQDRVTLSASYNCLFASYELENRIDVWDLKKERHSTHAYNVRPNERHKLLAHGEGLYMIEYDRHQHLINSIAFGENGCLLKPHYGLWYRHSIFAVGAIEFDGKKLMIFDSWWSFWLDKRLLLHSIWMPDHMPNAKEMATARILELTGAQEIRNTAVGKETKVWTGGINEEGIREILRSRYWELVV